VLGVSHGLDRLNAGQIVRNAAREFGAGAAVPLSWAEEAEATRLGWPTR